MVSYLTGLKRNEEKDFFRASLYSTVVFSVFNLSVSYLLIHLYLKYKHSREIKIAERSNMNMISSFISFRGHIVMFVFWTIMCSYNFYNHSQDFSKSSLRMRMPANIILVNFLTVILSLIFVFQKPQVLAFLKRKIAAKIEFIEISIPKINKIHPQSN